MVAQISDVLTGRSLTNAALNPEPVRILTACCWGGAIGAGRAGEARKSGRVDAQTGSQGLQNSSPKNS